MIFCENRISRCDCVSYRVGFFGDYSPYPIPEQGRFGLLFFEDCTIMMVRKGNGYEKSMEKSNSGPFGMYALSF
jgi:hypothetical protein